MQRWYCVALLVATGTEDWCYHVRARDHFAATNLARGAACDNVHTSNSRKGVCQYTLQPLPDAMGMTPGAHDAVVRVSNRRGTVSHHLEQVPDA